MLLLLVQTDLKCVRMSYERTDAINVELPTIKNSTY